MNKSLRLVMCAMPLVFMWNVARAEEHVSLKVKQERAKTEETLKEDVNSTNESCGSKISETINWSSFGSQDLSAYSISGYCGAPLTAIRMVCGTDAGKEAVQKAIKKVSCGFGGAGKRSAVLKDGTLTWKVDFKAGGDDDFVKAYLDNTL